MDKFSGGLNGSAEEEKVALENRNVQPKIQIVGGKPSRRPENQKFSWKSETSGTSRKVPGLRRISSDSFEFPADDSHFQRKGRNAACNSKQATENGDFQQSVGLAASSGENPVEVRDVQRFFCARSR